MEDGIARDLLLPYDRMMEGVRRTAMLYQDPSNRIPYGLFLRATDLRSRSPTALLPLCHAEADSQCKRICAEAALRACLCCLPFCSCVASMRDALNLSDPVVRAATATATATALRWCRDLVARTMQQSSPSPEHGLHRGEIRIDGRMHPPHACLCGARTESLMRESRQGDGADVGLVRRPRSCSRTKATSQSCLALPTPRCTNAARRSIARAVRALDGQWFDE